MGLEPIMYTFLKRMCLSNCTTGPFMFHINLARFNLTTLIQNIITWVEMVEIESTYLEILLLHYQLRTDTCFRREGVNPRRFPSALALHST